MPASEIRKPVDLKPTKMKKNKTPWYMWVLLFASILFFGYLHKELEEKRNPKIDPKTLIRKHPPNDGKMYRGWDWDKKEWIEDKSYNYHYNQHLYTDKELQQLREELEYDTEGRYFHIPGKRILTGEEETQEAIDDYIEDNIDDILDEYGN